MKYKKKKVEVVVPHRISGFFEIVDEINGKHIEEPSMIGSTGAGFNLSAVGKTTLEIKEESDDFSFDIFINGKNETKNADTSTYILNQLIKSLKIPIRLEIHHDFQLPVGCGYGASGSGALGLVFGLNYLLNLNIEEQELGKYAHISEVVNKTGLGTVCGQLSGGLSILTKPGYPCHTRKINIPSDILVICLSFGPILTKSILTNQNFKNRIKKAGRSCLKTLLKKPNIKTFAKVSFDFVRSIEILKLLNLERLEELIIALNKLNIIGASMNQLGRSVYAICKERKKSKIIDLLYSFDKSILYQELKIFNFGLSILY